MRTMRSAAGWAAVAWWTSVWLAAPGCRQPEPDDPREVYLAFYRAISEQDFDRAATYLTSETRQAFAEVGRRLQEAIDQPDQPDQKGDPLHFFLAGMRAEVHRPLRKIEVVEQTADRARLEVTAGDCDAGQEAAGEQCTVGQVELVRQDGRWRLAPHLPELVPPPAGRAAAGSAEKGD